MRHDGKEAYVHLRDGGAANVIEVKSTFWEDLMSGGGPPEVRALHAGGWLVTDMTMTADVDHWESHVDGEELVVVIDGEVDLVSEKDGRTWTTTLKSGDMHLNAKGTWHTFNVKRPTRAIFVTWGRGTEGRPR
jgi:uncharacterized cupin superfamily protein